MFILGSSVFYHDVAALLPGGRLVPAAGEERF
jgi:predicted NodU family carbamoyl transferase